MTQIVVIGASEMLLEICFDIFSEHSRSTDIQERKNLTWTSKDLEMNQEIIVFQVFSRIQMALIVLSS